MTPQNLAINFTHQDFSQSALSSFLQKSLPDFSPQFQNQLGTALSELLQNALEHGSSKEDQVTLLLEISPHQIEAQIDDQGHGPSPKTASELESIKQDQLSSHPHFDNQTKKGRGLFIASKSVDELTFHDLSSGGIRAHVLKSL